MSIERQATTPETSYADVDSMRVYLNEIGRIPRLTDEEVIELAGQRDIGNDATEKLLELENDNQGSVDPEIRTILEHQQRIGNQAKDKLMEANLRLVVSIAKRYDFGGMPLIDLIQEGNLGLMTAVNKFDASKGFKFSTYATWWIRQGVTRAIASKSSIVRIPSNVHENVVALNKLERAMENLGEDIDDDYIAETMRTSPSKLKDIRLARSVAKVGTLDKELDTDGTSSMTILDMIDDGKAQDAYERVELKIMSEGIENHFDPAGLSRRDSEIIRMRMGINDGEACTYDSIGEKMGITRESVRRIESSALNKLRVYFEWLGRDRDYAESTHQVDLPPAKANRLGQQVLQNTYRRTT